MRKLILVTTTVVIIIFFISCVSTTYKIGKEQFDSSAEALQRQMEIYSNIIKDIKPTQNPVGGSVLIIVPSDVELQKNYIRASSRTRQESLDYVTTASRNTNQFVADAIIKRRIFDSVSVERHNGNPASLPIGNNDFIIFRDVDGMFIKGKNKVSILPVTFDKNKPDGVPRTEAFLDELSQQAHNLRAK